MLQRLVHYSLQLFRQGIYITDREIIAFRQAYFLVCRNVTYYNFYAVAHGFKQGDR